MLISPRVVCTNFLAYVPRPPTILFEYVNGRTFVKFTRNYWTVIRTARAWATHVASASSQNQMLLIQNMQDSTIKPARVFCWSSALSGNCFIVAIAAHTSTMLMPNRMAFNIVIAPYRVGRVGEGAGTVVLPHGKCQ